MTSDQSEPAHYIFIANNLPTFSSNTDIPAAKIIRELLDCGVWLLGSRARNREQLKPGDKAIFYAAGQGNRFFVATAEIVTTCSSITPQERKLINKEILEEIGFKYPNLQSFRVTSSTFFTKPIQVKELVNQLSFIKNRDRWGVYFQGGSIKIPKRDFEYILDLGTPLAAG